MQQSNNKNTIDRCVQYLQTNSVIPTKPHWFFSSTFWVDK